MKTPVSPGFFHGLKSFRPPFRPLAATVNKALMRGRVVEAIALVIPGPDSGI
jgi:hypothetical protein